MDTEKGQTGGGHCQWSTLGEWGNDLYNTGQYVYRVLGDLKVLKRRLRKKLGIREPEVYGVQK